MSSEDSHPAVWHSAGDPVGTAHALTTALNQMAAKVDGLSARLGAMEGDEDRFIADLTIALFHLSPDAIVVIATGGDICLVNKQAEWLTGHHATALRGQPVEMLLPGYTEVGLDSENAGRFLSGVRRRGPWVDCDHVAVYGDHPRALLGTAHVRGGELIPGRLLSPIEIQQILENSPALTPLLAAQV